MTPTIQPYNLLVVEDNPAELHLLETAMKEADLMPLVNMVIAYDGEQAMDILENTHAGTSFHLTLLDLNLPKLSGKEVLKRIRESERLASTRVIIFTNSDDVNDIRQCQELKADAYVQKPRDFEQLIDFCAAIKQSIEMEGTVSMTYINNEFPR